jgi:hypothetical protein
MPTQIPDFLYDIPEDAPEAIKLHLRAQRVIQAAFYAFGDPEERKGSLTLGRDELLEVINFAAAMLTSARSELTRQDLRKETERQEKFVRLAAEAMREDTTPRRLLDALGISASKAH